LALTEVKIVGNTSERMFLHKADKIVRDQNDTFAPAVPRVPGLL